MESYFTFNLPEWLSYLETLHPSSIDLGLERIKKVAYALNLQRPANKVVTVTGTNGKGSCVAALASIYQQAGYQVGVYTSPHLWHFCERILINGSPVAEKDLCAQFIKIENARNNIPLTYFEFTTLAALLIFQQYNLDLAILEVGMGGRLDAVNIIDPDLAVITTVDLDHQTWLGETREQIGYEKAGIMRTEVPAVCGRAMPASVYEIAQTQNVPLYVLGKNFDAEIVNSEEFTWQHNEKILKNLPRNHLLVDNLALSLMVVTLLNTYFLVTNAAIIAGLKKCHLAGRQQIVRTPIWQMFDVAHNVQGIRCLTETLQQQPISGKTFAVFSMLRDKDIGNCVAVIAEQIDKWFIAGLDTERAVEAEELEQIIRGYTDNPVYTYQNISAAYHAACATATVNDRVIIFGSFYVVAATAKCCKWDN